MVGKLGMTADVAARKKFFYGKGCEKCNNTGYKGRMGIYVIPLLNDTLREMIVSDASLDDFRAACRKSGLRTIRETGMTSIHDGLNKNEAIVCATVLEGT